MKMDFSHLDYKKGITQVPKAVQVLRETPAFIKKHQLWKGFLDHKWILILTMLIMGTLSANLYTDIKDYILAPAIPSNFTEEGLEQEMAALEAVALFSNEEGKANLQERIQSLADTKEQLKEKHKPLFSGSYKQIRMIKVMGHKWVFGLVMYILVSIACGILSISYLTDFIMFFVYGFFLGFAFLDNYLEQFHFSIKKSSKQIQTHFGAATVLGIFASIGMLIPVIGPILIPFICAVAATIYGHRERLEAEALSMA